MNAVTYTAPVMMLALCGIVLPTAGTVSGRVRRWGAAACFLAEIGFTIWSVS